MGRFLLYVLAAAAAAGLLWWASVELAYVIVPPAVERIPG